jgi:hypothetical protein
MSDFCQPFFAIKNSRTAASLILSIWLHINVKAISIGVGERRGQKGSENLVVCKNPNRICPQKEQHRSNPMIFAGTKTTVFSVN